VGIVTSFMQADFPVGFVLLVAFATSLAILILFCVFALRH
jgi:hypothetical protein